MSTQLNQGMPREQVNIILGAFVCCSDQRLNQWTEQRRPPSQIRVKSSNLLRTRIEQKGRRKRNLLPLLKLRHPCFWFSSLRTETMADTTGFFGSQAFVCGLKLHTSFPGLPACRRQIVGLLSLHHHVRQSLTINLFLHIYR